MVSYPDSFPLAEIKNVVDVVRSGNVADDKVDFAHSLWVVQGYGQSQLIGNPDDNLVLSTQAVEDPVVVLEKLVAQAESDVPQAQMAVPWKLIVSWAASKLVDFLEKKYNN